MNVLKEMMAKIQEVEATSRIEPGDSDPRTRNGVEAMVRNAKGSLDKLYTDYKEAVMQSVVIIGVSGETGKEFAEKAEETGSLSVDFNLINDILKEGMSKRSVGDRYNSNAHMMFMNEISNIRLQFNIVRLPVPMINGYSDGIYDSPINEAIDKIIKKNYNASLNSAVTRRVIGAKALEKRFTGKKLPVLVYNLTGDVDTNFIPFPFATLESTGNVTLAGVKKKLSSIAAQLNSKGGEEKQETEGQPAQTQEST
jgi:hypothetical protein